MPYPTVPSQASPPRSPKSRETRPAPKEADPRPIEERRHREGVPEGQSPALKAGSGPADGPNGRYGRAQRIPDPGEQRDEPDDAHDGAILAHHDRRPAEHEPGARTFPFPSHPLFPPSLLPPHLTLSH